MQAYGIQFRKLPHFVAQAVVGDFQQDCCEENPTHALGRLKAKSRLAVVA